MRGGPPPLVALGIPKGFDYSLRMYCAQPSTRRAFTIAPAIFAMFLLVLALGGVYSWLMYSRLSAAPPGGLSSGGIAASVIIGTLIGLVLFLVIVSVIAAIVYFASGRSESAANITIGIFLVLALTGFSVNSYRLATAPPPPKQVTMADQMRANSDKMQESMDAQRQAMQRQSDAVRETMDRHQQAARDAALRQAEALRNATNRQPTPGQPYTPPPPPATQSNPNTAPNTPRPAPPARPNRPAPARAPSADEAAAKPILDALAAEITKQIDEVSAPLPALFDTLSRPPKQDIREIKKRIADITAVREPLAALSKRLNDMSTEGNDKLKAAGIDSVSAAHMFASDYKAMPRAFAADAIIRMLDDADTEATVLRDGIGRWSIGKDGKVESKDFSIKSKANSARFMLEASLDRKNRLLDDLKGR